MSDIPTEELIVDTRNYLRCLPPHIKECKSALMLSLLADEVERLQAALGLAAGELSTYGHHVTEPALEVYKGLLKAADAGERD